MTTTDTARSEAQAQLESIKSMLERLDHARECDGDDCELAEQYSVNDGQNIFIGDWLTVEEYHDEDEAEQAIYGDALEVCYRSGWTSAGEYYRQNGLEPEEYYILLCTGGPAVRIIGDLDNDGEPARARLEYQEWGTPWTEYITTGDDNQALMQYVSMFVFAS